MIVVAGMPHIKEIIIVNTMLRIYASDHPKDQLQELISVLLDCGPHPTKARSVERRLRGMIVSSIKVPQLHHLLGPHPLGKGKDQKNLEHLENDENVRNSTVSVSGWMIMGGMNILLGCHQKARESLFVIMIGRMHITGLRFMAQGVTLEMVDHQDIQIEA
jgi:hypothetical protein